MSNSDFYPRLSSSTAALTVTVTGDDLFIKESAPPAVMMADAKPVTFSELLKKQLQTTTAHGLPRIEAADKLVRKLYWAFIVVAGLGMFIWQSSVIITKYYARDTTISIEMKFDTSLDFPAITICNMNPVKLQSLERDPYLMSLVGYDNDEDDNLTGRRRRRKRNVETPTPAQLTTAPPSEVTTVRYVNWDNKDLNFESQNGDFVMAEEVQVYLASMNYTSRERYGHMLNDFLFDCSWMGYPCSPRNFSHFFNYMYGNCYTFNSGIGSVLSTSKSGPLYGLSLELYIEEEEYIPELQQSSGVRVIVHSQGLMPFPEDDGFLAAPGFKTSVGLRQLRLDRQPHPYSECVDTIYGPDNIFKDFFETYYSRKACEKDCLNWAVQFHCNCTDLRYRYFQDYPVCDISQQKVVDCINTVQGKLENGQLSPTCPNTCSQPCSEITYEATVSNAVWPNSAYRNVLLRDLMQTSSEIRYKVEADDTFISDNMVKIDIYYNDLNYEAIGENVAYTGGDVISNLGGQVGLWIGVSVMTCFEFFEFLYDVMVLFLIKLTRAPQRKRVSTPIIPLRHNNRIDFS
ncbi:amiloride-sensitive sodium channel subunit alpha-like [Ptychodera flava]|uniref:amiloride-sensitive sodium channel subunit alpha-like n=1 Tax=Ptychodera flava TaxID=63121 RepID=UPI003969C3D6